MGQAPPSLTAIPSSLRQLSRWYKFDDEFVMELNGTTGAVETTIISESAYLLFYKKKQLSPQNILRYL